MRQIIYKTESGYIVEQSLYHSIHHAQLILTRLEYQQWKSHLFSGNWWMLLSALLIPWIFWWLLVKKERLFEVLTYALFVVIFGGTLDTYGKTLGWWDYGTRLFFLNPGLIAGDWGLPPVVKSLAYQYFPDWPRFVAVQVILGAVFSFVGKPILHALGIYLMYNWSYLESFLLYIPVALLTKLIVDLLKKHIPVERQD